jgi:hypothetical protein
MSITLILRRVTRDCGHVHSAMETLEVDCPELERALNSGGRGGGPDGDDFEYTELVGAATERKP